MARNDRYQEIFGLRAENDLSCRAYPLISQMAIVAWASRIALGGIGCVLSCCCIDGPSRGAEKSLRRASDSESVHAFQMYQNHGDVWISPQLEYLNSSVLVIAFAVGVGTGSVASYLAGRM
jgi:hypothetical protein